METIWTIRVKTLNSETSSPVQLASTSSVPDLKSSIHEALGIATERQRLIFRGRVLKNSESLVACSLEDGVTIHLVERAQDAPALPPGAQDDGSTTFPRRNNDMNTTRGSNSANARPGAPRTRIRIGFEQDLGQHLSSQVLNELNSLFDPPTTAFSPWRHQTAGAETTNARSRLRRNDRGSHAATSRQTRTANAPSQESTTSRRTRPRSRRSRPFMSHVQPRFTILGFHLPRSGNASPPLLSGGPPAYAQTYPASVPSSGEPQRDDVVSFPMAIPVPSISNLTRSAHQTYAGTTPDQRSSQGAEGTPHSRASPDGERARTPVPNIDWSEPIFPPHLFGRFRGRRAASSSSMFGPSARAINIPSSRNDRQTPALANTFSPLSPVHLGRLSDLPESNSSVQQEQARSSLNELRQQANQLQRLAENFRSEAAAASERGVGALLDESVGARNTPSWIAIREMIQESEMTLRPLFRYPYQYQSNRSLAALLNLINAGIAQLIEMQSRVLQLPLGSGLTSESVVNSTLASSLSTSTATPTRLSRPGSTSSTPRGAHHGTINAHWSQRVALPPPSPSHFGIERTTTSTPPPPLLPNMDGCVFQTRRQLVQARMGSRASASLREDAAPDASAQSSDMPASRGTKRRRDSARSDRRQNTRSRRMLEETCTTSNNDNVSTSSSASARSGCATTTACSSNKSGQSERNHNKTNNDNNDKNPNNQKGKDNDT